MIIIGLMSGTSLDGVDMALCDITSDGYSVLDAVTIPYPDHWRQRLSTLEKASALDYALANADLGHYLGRLVREFMQRSSVKVEAVASHGHTIFHQPERGLTTQIGDGDAIAAECGLPVVSNFRTLDVALGGQGAPLVPIGDRLLFGQYDACLNLGGIANVSYRSADGGCRSAVGGCRSAVDEGGCRSAVDEGGSVTLAYDICPCNMLLNSLAARLGLAYDPDGRNARSGAVKASLLASADALPYYRQQPPKSLGKEWFMANIEPLFAREHHDDRETRDLLRTAVEHIATQIAQVVNRQQLATMLVTGGGAHNAFLIDRLRQLTPHTRITIPDALTIDYKEAIVFALLGYLRLIRRPNTLRSVTGAQTNTISGTLSGLF